VTCDTALFDLDEGNVPRVLLIKRKHDPFKGMWALPGGFLEMDEELEDAATRELYEETGVDLADTDILQQVCVVGTVGRDPRDRIISVVYTAVVDRFEYDLCANDDAEEVAWFKLDELPILAADHLEIIRRVLGVVYYDYG
jgi:8-oxo-dGTP diphosphatase